MHNESKIARKHQQDRRTQRMVGNFSEKAEQHNRSSLASALWTVYVNLITAALCCKPKEKLFLRSRKQNLP